ncbi:hypothetical protein NQ317_010581 [Molorchus minor]|uniref:Uncharacterized protein n=1 Tax=Molorchus minor TaxID=1323400 RepID=A0ABQ9J5B5_9CUCU|nr:hypothetical protein NQ317_010581 [Molorchus minor]
MATILVIPRSYVGESRAAPDSGDISSVEIDTLSGLVDNNLCVIFYVFDVDRIDFDALFLLIASERSVSDHLKEISPILNAAERRMVMKKSEVLTSTPFKNELEEKNKKKAAGVKKNLSKNENLVEKRVAQEQKKNKAHKTCKMIIYPILLHNLSNWFQNNYIGIRVETILLRGCPTQNNPCAGSISQFADQWQSQDWGLRRYLIRTADKTLMSVPALVKSRSIPECASNNNI